MSILLLVNLAATLFLTGVAWVLQIVQLPLFLHARDAEFVGAHRIRNTLVMALPMAAELIAAIWLGRITLLLPVAAIWLVTFFWYIPLHRRLAASYDEAGVRRLIALNWIRTICWSGRAMMLLWLAAGHA